MFMDYVFAIGLTIGYGLFFKVLSDYKKARAFWYKVVCSEIEEFEVKNPEFQLIFARGDGVKIDRVIFYLAEDGKKKLYCGYGGEAILMHENIIKEFNAGRVLKYQHQTLEKFVFPVKLTSSL